MSKMRELKEAAAWIEDTKKQKWFYRREGERKEGKEK